MSILFLQSAFIIVFPMTKVEACFFHLGQSLNRAVIRCGFKVRYETDRDFATTIRAFSALAFLPLEYVEAAFEKLEEEEDIPEKFLSYFETNYVGNLTRRQGRRPAVFPMEFWNVHDRLRQSAPRTNNEVRVVAIFLTSYVHFNEINVLIVPAPLGIEKMGFEVDNLTEEDSQG